MAQDDTRGIPPREGPRVPTIIFDLVYLMLGLACCCGGASGLILAAVRGTPFAALPALALFSAGMWLVGTGEFRSSDRVSRGWGLTPSMAKLIASLREWSTAPDNRGMADSEDSDPTSEGITEDRTA